MSCDISIIEHYQEFTFWRTRRSDQCPGCGRGWKGDLDTKERRGCCSEQRRDYSALGGRILPSEPEEDMCISR